ncbi:hypothetical protein CPC16_010918 [Podila verticillata]|nr:hypothetical protein CPC16_010918 [Podila verticillata]
MSTSVPSVVSIFDIALIEVVSRLNFTNLWELVLRDQNSQLCGNEPPVSVDAVIAFMDSNPGLERLEDCLQECSYYSGVLPPSVMLAIGRHPYLKTLLVNVSVLCHPGLFQCLLSVCQRSIQELEVDYFATRNLAAPNVDIAGRMDAVLLLTTFPNLKELDLGSVKIFTRDLLDSSKKKTKLCLQHWKSFDSVETVARQWNCPPAFRVEEGNMMNWWRHWSWALKVMIAVLNAYLQDGEVEVDPYAVHALTLADAYHLARDLRDLREQQEENAAILFYVCILAVFVAIAAVAPARGLNGRSFNLIRRGDAPGTTLKADTRTGGSYKALNDCPGSCETGKGKGRRG